MKQKRGFIYVLLGGLLMLSSCSTKVDFYGQNQPKVDVKEYFNGSIKAWGTVHNWRGQAVSQFTADICGSWEGDTGTLEEIFYYPNGEKLEREWTFKKENDSSYRGFADDILGEARIEQAGNAINLRYTLALKMNGKKINVKFDDWIWRISDEVVINRAKIKKFGLPVGSLTVVMQKDNTANACSIIRNHKA